MGMNTASVQRLYVAYFNRPADPLAIADYEAMLPSDRVATQAELLVLAETYFSPSTEYQTNFDGLGNADIVNELYLNIFGRPADVDGLKSWTAALNNKTETVASLALSLSFNAQLTDAAVVNARIEAAIAYTNGLDTAEEILGYQGPAAIASATAYLEQISGALPTTDAAITAQKTTAIANVDTSIAAMVEVGGPAGPEQALTTGIDDLTGSDKRDTFKGYVAEGAATTSTLNTLDQIDGGDGNDTLEIAALTTLQTASLSTNLTSVEAITARAIGDVTLNTAAIAGLTSLTITAADAATLSAAATTDVTVSGADGVVAVDGGKDVKVTDSAGIATSITIGATTVNAGSITVTQDKQAAKNLVTDGGTAVNITSTNVSTGQVKVGQGGAATDLPSGAVVVKSTGAASAANTDLTLGAITIDGGSTVKVTQNATSSAAVTATDANGATHTQSAVNIDAGATTTSVVVTQDAAAAEVLAVTAVAGVKQVDTITFAAMDAGDTAILGGLTFTASVALTAAQAAAAFADLASGAKVGPAATSQGFYTGVFGAFTTGSVTTTATTSTVEATEKTATTGDMTIGIGGTGGAATTKAAKTAGVTAVAGKTGVLGVAGGAVDIDGAAGGTDAVTTVTLDGVASYNVDSDVLSTLNVSNTNGAGVIQSASTGALTVNLDKVGKAGGAATLASGAALTSATLNATTASVLDLTADTVTALTVNATGSLDLTGSSLTAVKSVTVTGAGAVTLDEDANGAALTTVDASANTGGVTYVKELITGATFTGGDGKDSIKVAATTKAQTTGGGDDTVEISVSALGAGGSVDAGTGTDTLKMTGTLAEAATADAAFEATVTNFNKLELDVTANGDTDTVNLANLDDISYVLTKGAAEQAQVTTITFVNDTTDNAHVVAFDLDGTTFSETGTSTIAQLATKFAADIDALAAYGATQNAGVVTVTAAVAGTPFVVDNVAVTGATTTVTPATTTAAVGNGEAALTGMADNGTVQMSGQSTDTVVTMADATGGSDSLNVVVAASTADVKAGLLTVANVETVNVTSSDVLLDNNADGTDEAVESNSLTLTANKATKVVVAGNADMALTLTGSALVTTIDAGTSTGALTVTTAVSTAAVTVTGGGGADVLTSSGSGDTLIGGAGADKLTGSTLTTLTGGDGVDTFFLNVPATLNSYSNITDATAGDLIDLGTSATTAFIATATVLAGTADFQDYANAAVNALGADTDDATWFQYDGNTYIVKSGDNNAAAGFVDGTDSIIKLTGLVNLGNASFNSTDSTLEIG